MDLAGYIEHLEGLAQDPELQELGCAALPQRAARLYRAIAGQLEEQTVAMARFAMRHGLLPAEQVEFWISRGWVVEGEAYDAIAEGYPEYRAFLEEQRQKVFACVPEPYRSELTAIHFSHRA